MEQEDFIAEGFKRITDEDLAVRNPPKIRWGDKYKAWDDKKKIEYLEKLANSMNHAVSLLQDERDQLNKLCEMKEGQLVKLSEALKQNNEMLHHEITRMNKEKQGLNARIKELIEA